MNERGVPAPESSQRVPRYRHHTMIFWNALAAAALRARCACAMYKYRLLAAAGGFYPMEGRRVRFLLLIPVSIVLLMAYNTRSQSRSTSAKKNVVKEGAVPAKR